MKRKVNTKLDIKINNTRQMMYRALKNKRLFGTFITSYKPFCEEETSYVYKKVFQSFNFVINGIFMSTSALRSFGDTLKIAYLILEGSKADGIPAKVIPERVLSSLCEYYFNDNKDKYKYKMSQIEFESIFGLAFLTFGLILLSIGIYLFVGYLCLIFFLTFIYISSILGKVYLTKSKMR